MMKVDVYVNLHKSTQTQRVYSIRSREKGESYNKVVGYASSVQLTNATFVVSEKGKQKVMEHKRKLVHAVIRGELVEGKGIEAPNQATFVSYCPYQAQKPAFYRLNHPTFSQSTLQQVITCASRVWCNPTNVKAIF